MTSAVEVVSMTDLAQQIAKEGYITGIWTPSLRRELKDAGYLVLKDRQGYTVSMNYQPLAVLIVTFLNTQTGETVWTLPRGKWIYAKEKVPKAVIRFYLDKGLVVSQEAIHWDDSGEGQI